MADEWRPPSEGDLKVIEARRERNDKISSIMGDYLLRGYKMLGEACDKCETILLESRQGVKYCVACQEVDVQETAKDDPVMNEQAARRLCQEHPTPSSEQASSSVTSNPVANSLPSPHSGGSQSAGGGDLPDRPQRLGSASKPQTSSAASNGPSAVITSGQTGGSATTSHDTSRPGNLGSPTSTSGIPAKIRSSANLPRLSCTAETLSAKVEWATAELAAETLNLDRCRQLAQVIMYCCEALTAVNRAQSSGSGDK